MAQNLVAKAQKFREIDEPLQHDKHPNVAEKLQEICKFLQEHETPSINDCTHTVFEKYPDWWMGPKPSFMLAVAEDNTCDLLHRYCGLLFDLGIPLTLAEKRTPEIRFVQDVEIWGTKDEAMQAAELLKPDGKFLNLLGSTLGEIYPDQKFLDLVAFDASGLSQVKGIQKTSLRLVWPAVVVDKERAGRIRDYILHQFKQSKETEINEMETRILAYNTENGWNSVFTDAIYFGRHGIRMPLNDRVSPPPLKKPERRPFAPFGVFRYNYAEGNVQSCDKLYGPNDLQGHEWMKIGALRRDAGTALTEWTPPALRGQSASRSAQNSMVPAARNKQLGASSGQVKVRTKMGSDGDRKTRGPGQGGPSMTREERLVTVEREFDGTADEFREKLEAQMPKEQGSFDPQDDRLVWKQAEEGGARIEFKKDNKRVYIVGKPHQIRSLLNVIAPFAKEIGENARSVATSVRSGGATSERSHGGSSHGGSRAPSGAGYAPSAAYAPSAVYAPSAGVYASSTVSYTGGSAAANRIVVKPFEPQGQGELDLNEGDIVTMTHDPQEGEHNLHRWVYGKVEGTDRAGWFPFSHTQPMQEPVDAASA